MRLRTRMQEELKTRLGKSLPEAMATVWDHVAVVVVIEQLKFKNAGGVDAGWTQLSKFSGVCRAELRSDQLDDLGVEPLITDLVANTMYLPREADTPIGGLSGYARAVLAEWRDVVRETQVVSALRFTVEGCLMRYDGEKPIPQILMSQAPDIGPGHEPDYKPIGEGVA